MDPQASECFKSHKWGTFLFGCRLRHFKEAHASSTNFAGCGLGSLFSHPLSGLVTDRTPCEDDEAGVQPLTIFITHIEGQ